MNDLIRDGLRKARTMASPRQRHLATAIIAATLVGLTPAAQAQISFTEETLLNDFDDTESWGASWGDMNGDLWPDLFVVNHRNRSSIFRNNGDGTFTNNVLQADLSRTWLNGPLIDTHGAAWADFDRDGDEDLTQQTGFCCDAILMVNDGTGRFTNEVATYQMQDDREGRTPLWWDFDLNGTLDLMVASGSMRLWENAVVPSTPPFPNVATTSGLSSQCWTNQWGIVTDMDNDNDMEYICAAEGDFPQRTLNYEAPSFTVNPYLPASTIAHALDSAVADFDGDLLPDIFVTRGNIMPTQAEYIDVNGVNSRIESWLTTGFQNGYRTITFKASGPLTINAYSNQVGFHFKIYLGITGINPADDGGDQSFTEFTVDPGNTDHHGLLYEQPGFDPDTQAARGTYVGYDPINDLWTLTLVPGEQSSRGYYTIDSDNATALTDMVLTGALPQDEPIIGSLLMNNGTGFTDEWFARMSPFTKQRCVSVASGDFDNDMDLDLYLVCRGGIENISNRLFTNDGAGNFTEVTNFGAEGLIGLGLASKAGTGENVVMADYNIDGRLDLFVTNGLLMQPFLIGAQDQIFKNNTTNSNNWVQFDLEGVTSNVEGVGAKVYITTDVGGANEKIQLREQGGGMHRWSQHHQRIHVGLGSNTVFDMTVHWPMGGTDTYTGLSANELYKVTEGDTAPPVALTPGPAVGDPAPVAGDECGEPGYLDAYDPGVYLWKDCANSDEWRLDLVGGDIDGTLAQSGQVISDMALTNVTPISLESFDVLDDSVSGTITFGLSVAATALDAFTFSAGTGATSCITFDDASVPLYLGAHHVRAEGPINLDDITASCLTLSGADVTVSEDAGSVNVNLTLNEASLSDITLDLTTQDGSAVAGSDYSSSSSTVTFAAGTTTQTVNIAITDDSTSESVETFTVELSNAVGVILNTTSITVTITDDEAGPCGEPTVNAASEKALFIWHDCGTDQWHAKATAGTDSGVQHMGTLLSTQSFNNVTPISFEGNDVLTTNGNQISFNVFMSSPGFDQIDFEIADGSPLCVNTANSAIPVLVGEAKNPLNTQGDANALNACPALIPGTSVTGPYGNGNGASSHFAALFATFEQSSSDLELTFDAFDVDNATEVGVYLNNQLQGFVPPLNNATQPVTMTIAASSQVPGTNLIEFRHNIPTGIWGIENLLLTPPPMISVADVTVDESAGTAAVSISLSAPAPATGVSVDISTIDGSATAPGDYTAVSATTVTIAAGESTASTMITIVNDALPELAETFDVTLSNPVGGLLGDATAVVTITDNDASAQCGKPAYSPGGSTPVIALWQNCDPGSANYLKWQLDMADGADANNAPSEYTGTLTSNPLTAFVSATTISFEGIDALSNNAGVLSFITRMNNSGIDSIVFEPAGGTSTCLAFSNSPITNVIVGAAGTPVSLPFNIEDQTNCTVYELSVDDLSVDEDAGAANLVVSVSSAPASDITVTVSTSDDTATSPSDYTSVSSSATISAGQTSTTVPVTIIDDATLESTEAFNVTLSNPSGASIDDGSAIVTINDDDAPTQCGEPTFSAGGATPVIALWQNCATGEWTLEMVDGADAGNTPSNYSGSLTSSPASNFAAVSTISFEGIDNVNGVINNGAIPAASTLNFDTRMNGFGSDVIVFTPSTNTDTCLDFSTSPVTTVLVGASNMQVSLPFDIETQGACATPAAELSIGDLSVDEDVGMANVIVSLSNAQSSNVTVDVSSTNASAQAPGDYTALSATSVTIAAGQTQATVPVTIIDDTVTESAETFTLTLSNPSGATIDDGTGVVTINANDDLVQCGKPTFTPGGGTPVIALWQNCTTDEWIVQMADGAGGGASDYTGSLTAQPANNFATARTFSFEGIDNLNGVTNNGSIPAASVLNFVTRMNGAGTDSVAFRPASATATCLDFSVSPVTSVLVGAGNMVVNLPFDIQTFNACGSGSTPDMTIGDVTVDEDQGTANITVSLSAATTSTVTVDVNSSDASAVSPGDYTAVNTSVTITAGQTSATFPVTIIDDNTSEATETFTLTLSNAAGATIVDANAIVTINDDELSVQCGKPTFTPGGATPVIALWQDCATGIWSLQTVDGADAGNTPSDYTGSLTSSPLITFDSASTISFEGIDNVNGITGNGTIPAATILNFTTRMNANGFDTVLFEPASATSTCLDFSQSPVTTVLVGASNTQVAYPFAIETLGACN